MSAPDPGYPCPDCGLEDCECEEWDDEISGAYVGAQEDSDG